MDVPRPTVAPPGRLVRLGVVLDTRNPIERLLEVARMCDRAGIGALWVEDVEEAGVGPAPAAGVGDAGDDAPRLDAWTALALLAGEVRSARIGAVLDAAAWPPTRLARMAATLGALTGGRFELTLRGSAASAAGAVRAFREALAATTVPAALAPPAEPAAAGPAVLLAAGGPAYGAVALPAEPATIGVQLAAAAAPAAGGVPGAPGGPATPAAEVIAVPPGPEAEVIAVVDGLVLPTVPLAATLAAAAAPRRRQRPALPAAQRDRHPRRDRAAHRHDHRLGRQAGPRGPADQGPRAARRLGRPVPVPPAELSRRLPSPALPMHRPARPGRRQGRRRLPNLRDRPGLAGPQPPALRLLRRRRAGRLRGGTADGHDHAVHIRERQAGPGADHPRPARLHRTLLPRPTAVRRHRHPHDRAQPGWHDAHLLTPGWMSRITHAGSRCASRGRREGPRHGIAVCLAAIPVVAAPAPSSWPFIAASACLHVGYNLVLMRSYRLGDLSQVYPLARGVAPLLVAGVAAALRPTWRKGAASGVLSLAAYGLVLWGPAERWRRSPRSARPA